MCNPLVSVIVPVYRNPEWVKTALNSVIKQTWKNLEILVVDDGSPDGCDEVCDRFAALDDRIHVVHRDNGGVSAARNDGLSMAKGEFVAFLDSDDFYAEDHVASLVQCALENNADIVSNRMYFYLSDTCTRRVTESDSVMELSREEAIVSMHSENEKFNGYLMNKLFRREILVGARFDPAIAIHEDMLFIWQAVLKSNVIVSCEKYTYHYLFHPSSAVNSYSPRYDTAVVAAKRMFSMMRDHFPEKEYIARKTLLFALLSVANKRYSSGALDDKTYREILREVNQYHSKKAYSYIVGIDNKISYRALRLGRIFFILWKKTVALLKK